MAVSSLDYLFLNNLLHINNCKYHRSRFNANTNVQYWVCSEKKKIKENPTSNPREIYDKLLKSYAAVLTMDELSSFTSALNKHSTTESTIRRIRVKKGEVIGKMPTTQGKFYIMM